MSPAVPGSSNVPVQGPGGPKTVRAPAESTIANPALKDGFSDKAEIRVEDGSTTEATPPIVESKVPDADKAAEDIRNQMRRFLSF